MARRPGRPRGGSEALSRERISAAALAIVDAQGLSGLSMRRLASALGVDPMAIYRHLPGKRAVVAAMLELVFGELRVAPAAAADWQEQVRGFARSYRALARTHPNLVLQLVSDAEAGARAALAASEGLYAALAAAGLSPKATLHAADLLIDFLNGFALADATGRVGQAGERQPLRLLLDAAAPEQYPALRRVFDSLAAHELAGDFERELALVLAGIAARQTEGATCGTIVTDGEDTE